MLRYEISDSIYRNRPWNYCGTDFRLSLVWQQPEYCSDWSDDFGFDCFGKRNHCGCHLVPEIIEHFVSFVKALILSILSGLSVVLVSLFLLRTADRRNANKIIAAVDEYRATYGQLPDPDDQKIMKELGFEMRMEWFPDYQMGENGNFRITILQGFDGPYWIYDSSMKSWREGFDYKIPEIN